MPPVQGYMGIHEDLCVSFMADPATTTLLGMSAPWLQENSVGSCITACDSAFKMQIDHHAFKYGGKHQFKLDQNSFFF